MLLLLLLVLSLQENIYSVQNLLQLLLINQNLSYHNDQSEETVKPLRANETTESNGPEARENVSDLVRIGFCFRSDWLSFWTNHRAK